MRGFSSGYLRVGRYRGAPIRIHWTTPIAVFVLTRFSFNPLVWAALLGVLFVHEMGHALVAQQFHMRLVSIDITGVGGTCRLEGDPTVREAAIVAWGGVIAQAALLVVAIILRMMIGDWLDSVFHILITSNVVLIALNLLPIAPLDGATAWRLFKS
jgi:Zn-dependent protease